VTAATEDDARRVRTDSVPMDTESASDDESAIPASVASEEIISRLTSAHGIGDTHDGDFGRHTGGLPRATGSAASIVTAATEDDAITEKEK